MQEEHVNVTPLIDVVMCLIIFFLVCGKLAKDESAAGVDIPKAFNGQELGEQRNRLVINLIPQRGDPAAEPEIQVRKEAVGAGLLTQYLRREKANERDLKLILRADKAQQYQWIEPILLSAAQAGIKSINFVAKQEKR